MFGKVTSSTSSSDAPVQYPVAKGFRSICTFRCSDEALEEHLLDFYDEEDEEQLPNRKHNFRDSEKGPGDFRGHSPTVIPSRLQQLLQPTK